jgi:hypothetical protein
MWLSKVIPRSFRGLSFAENRPPAWPESHPATVAYLHGRENTADFRGSLPRNLLTTQILRAHAETFTASTRSSLCHAARGGKNVHSAVRKIAALFLFCGVFEIFRCRFLQPPCKLPTSGKGQKSAEVVDQEITEMEKTVTNN